MRRVSLVDYGKLELHENCESISKLQPGTVKVNVSACSICGSDVSLFNGKRSLVNERYFGHEFSGVVVDAGDGANGIEVGMRVASELSKACGQCWNCLNGLFNYCKSMNDALLPGGFSEETLVLNVPEYSFISPIPSSIDDITATLLEPTNCSYHVALQANIKPGETVLVFGLGSIGIITALIMKSMGVGVVIGVEKSKTRLEKIRELNLLETVDRNDSDWLEQVKEIGGKNGVDVVIEASGAVSVLHDAFCAVRPGGRIVVASVYHGPAGDIDMLPIMRKEITIIGSKGPFPHRKTDGSSASVEILVNLQDDLRKLITVYEFENALKAFDNTMNGTDIKSVITFK